MTIGTGISWAHATFNPWVGCTKVSAACDHCYAEAWSKRGGGVKWGAGETRRRTRPHYWRQPIKWNRDAAKTGEPFRVFCASLADVFDAEVPEAWRIDLFRVIASTPHLTWMLLTKRPKVAHDFLSDDGTPRLIATAATETGITPQGFERLAKTWPLPNVWLGVTVENQKMADLRVPLLLQTPAAKRFLSCEPLLGPVDLRAVDISGDSYITPLRAWTARELSEAWGEQVNKGQSAVDWIIVGGESGPKARPSHPDWFRSLRDQCEAAGVPFHFKQWGEWAPLNGWLSAAPPHRGVTKWDERNASLLMGKKRAGRLLDGREHLDFPA